MGHFKTAWRAARLPGRDASGKFRMQPVTSGGGETLAERDFGAPPCVAAFNAWNITSDQVVPIENQPVSYFIYPTSASILCDGDCLDWSMTLTCEGANVTLEPAEDCVGVTVTFDDTIEALRDCTATLNAVVTSSGSQFGTTINLTPFPSSPFMYSDVTGTIAVDVLERATALECIDTSWGGETWLPSQPALETYDPSLFAWNVTQFGTNFQYSEGFDFEGRPQLTITAAVAQDQMCGEWIKAEPTYNGAPANGPLLWSVDEAP